MLSVDCDTFGLTAIRWVLRSLVVPFIAEVIGDNMPAPKTQHAPDIQWAKNLDWTHTLIKYLGDHVTFCLKLFSDLTADAVREGCQGRPCEAYSKRWQV
jgi:hypothetical protein